MAERRDFTIGLDLGQVHEPTALAVVERVPPYDGHTRNNWAYYLRQLRRFPAGTPYTDVVPAVAELVAAPPLKGSPVVADQTGVGQALVKRLRETLAHSRVVRVILTTGQTYSCDEDGLHHLPKKDLVTCLQLLLQGRRLKVSRALPHADDLVRELASFRTKVSLAADRDFAAWRENPHDDLVLAVALACWQAEREPLWIWEPSVDAEGSYISRLPEGVFLT